jgi:hypothetical protein
MSLDRIRDLTSDELDALLARLRQRWQTRVAAPASQLTAPLSLGQERVYVAARMTGDRAVYNMPLAFLIGGRLEVERLRVSLAALIARHESLRTAFVLDGSAAMQVVAPHVDVPLTVVSAARDQLTALIADETARPFTLERPPLFRVLLATLDNDERLLMFSFHHIICDGWSTGVFLRDLAALYRGPTDARPLPSLPLQYRHYVQWRRESACESGEAWWRQRLAGAPLFVRLPQARRVRPATANGDALHRSIDEALTTNLLAIAREENATPFMILAAALQVLVHHDSGQTDFVILCPVADRELPGTEDLVGYFVDLLPLRADLRDLPPFRALVGRVRRAVLDGLSHGAAHAERLLEDLRAGAPWDAEGGVTPILNVRNEPRTAVAMDGISLQAIDVPQPTTRGGFILNADLRDGRLHWLFEYWTSLFDREAVVSTLDRLEDLLRLICHDPDAPVDALGAELTRTARRARAARERELAAAAAASLTRVCALSRSSG